MGHRPLCGSVVIAVFALVLGAPGLARGELNVRDPNVIAVGGTLANGAFTFPVTLPAGALLLLDVDADVLGSPLDSVLEVDGPTGAAIASNDNDFYTFDSALGLVVPATGSYTIRLTDKQGRTGANFFFLVKGMLLSPQASGVPATTRAGANFLTVAGVLTASPWTTQVALPGGSMLVLDVDAETLGSPLDSVLEVVDPSGTVVARNDDGLRSFDSSLAVKIATAGTYTIRITDAQGRSGASFFFLLKGELVPAR